MDDTLSKLFGSAARVKLLRLFLFNPNQALTAPEAAEKARVSKEDARRETAFFVKLGLLNRSRGRTKTYALDPKFPYAVELQTLLLNTSAHVGEIHDRLRKVGTLKLIVVAGIFLGEWEGRLDLFIVADRVREEALKKNIKILESEIGRDIRYALLTEQEFFYRLNMNDHLVRDVLDYTHRIVYDRLDIGLK